MSTLVLVRPGFTTFDLQQRIQGDIDLPAIPESHEQWARTARDLEVMPLESVLAAQCEPAYSAARFLAGALELPLRVVREFDAPSLGLWQGLTVEEIRHRHPRTFRQWVDAPLSVSPPDGVPFGEVAERVTTALRKLQRREGHFVIVASEPVASLIAAIVRGTPPHDLPLCGARETPAWELLQPVPAVAITPPNSPDRVNLRTQV